MLLPDRSRIQGKPVAALGAVCAIFAAMQLSMARYRLRFIHPFGTAHGMRDGTDSVFLKVAEDGFCGYGEATLPPYLEFSQESVYESIRFFWLNRVSGAEGDALFSGSDGLPPPARAAMEMCYNDLICNLKGVSYETFYGIQDVGPGPAPCMVTIGHTSLTDIPLKIKELPNSDVLKVKLGSANDLHLVKALLELDDRPMFLDANQGWSTVSQALDVVAEVGVERLAGLEQPFEKTRWDLHAGLREQLTVPVYADESIQGMEDLERAAEVFGGVNLKLMKCGGLATALRMARRAKELGMKVMLGSMSESTLGCAAMASLQAMADLVDLDGPWLIANDPFEGLAMGKGGMVKRGRVGIGVRLRDNHGLDFVPIGT